MLVWVICCEFLLQRRAAPASTLPYVRLNLQPRQRYYHLPPEATPAAARCFGSRKAKENIPQKLRRQRRAAPGFVHSRLTCASQCACIVACHTRPTKKNSDTKSPQANSDNIAKSVQMLSLSSKSQCLNALTPTTPTFAKTAKTLCNGNLDYARRWHNKNQVRCAVCFVRIFEANLENMGMHITNANLAFRRLCPPHCYHMVVKICSQK